jgi:glycosyltransferase involved in cell wall biosynthesis
MEKFIQFGFDQCKFSVSNLCYDIQLIDTFINKVQNESTASLSKEKYILYVGRIEEIKGIRTLMEAMKGTNMLLKIVGNGNAQDDMKALMESEGIKNVQFLGFKNKVEVFDLTNNSLFGVCPSEWYENLPFSVSETFLFSKPVVGANIGGIPELIIDNKTGLLFETGNIIQLREKLLTLWNDDQLINTLGKNAREHAYNLYNYETHWLKLNKLITR